MDKINEFLKKNYRCVYLGGREIQEATKRIICKDGFNISVQANEYAYCTPRKNKAWPYERVELGYPSDIDELIDLEYAECPGTTDTIYAYVPIEIVNKLIEKHGGIAN